MESTLLLVGIIGHYFQYDYCNGNCCEWYDNLRSSQKLLIWEKCKNTLTANRPISAIFLCNIITIKIIIKEHHFWFMMHYAWNKYTIKPNFWCVEAAIIQFFSCSILNQRKNAVKLIINVASSLWLLSTVYVLSIYLSNLSKYLIKATWDPPISSNPCACELLSSVTNFHDSVFQPIIWTVTTFLFFVLHMICNKCQKITAHTPRLRHTLERNGTQSFLRFFHQNIHCSFFC